jgi:hypothetical protein
MNKLLLSGMSLSFMLAAGTAMAASDQAAEKFQTLGQMQSIQTTAITPMTGTDLQAVEGKMRWRGGHRSYSYRSNRNTTTQSNTCIFCFARGGGITQVNENYTVQR